MYPLRSKGYIVLFNELSNLTFSVSNSYALLIPLLYCTALVKVPETLSNSKRPFMSKSRRSRPNNLNPPKPNPKLNPASVCLPRTLLPSRRNGEIEGYTSPLSILR